ncbi:hypothetical protein KKD52_06065 [Myxococcota bacterium]|nr:hypothetical protein [Myxococcota bacterium]MBU1413554.1 hypothetical protein [Myxococcota bacterium]MBU1509907.1 hypothetical protein [Myxococcota bacterium]PKN25673.1 MAG: hypothetical protein CVU65_08100 [Deltaproteobacteria bacterium HGW-Deltaproteobacteria-22]
MKKNKWILGFVLLLAACSPRPKVTVQAQRIVIRQISLEYMLLEVRYQVHNPHPVAISVLEVDQTLELSNTVAARGQLEKPVSIPAKKSEQLNVLLKVPFLPMLTPAKDLLTGRTVRYRLVSDMKMKTILGRESRRVLREGELELPLLPGGGLAGLKNVRLEGGPLGTLKLDMIILVPRPKKQLMDTTQVEYLLRIENHTIADGRFPLTRGPENMQKVTIPVSWPIARGATWLPRLATGLPVQFRLRFDLGDETEFLIDKKDTIRINPFSL